MKEEAMADRRWTVMVIPHGSDSPRSYSVTERALRITASVGAAFGFVALIGIGNAIASLGGPLRQVARASAPNDLAAVAARVASLRDTIGVIHRREQQIRLLAGLPAVDSVAGTVSASRTNAGEVVSTLGATDTASRGLHLDVETLLKRAEMLSSRFAAVTDSLSHNAQRFASMPSIMPTAGWLSSNFSRNRLHPLLHTSRPHEGIDVAAPMGAPIVAPASGVVRSVGQESGYGLTFEVDHGNGIVTRYAHCSHIDVRAGQRVTRGQRMAAVGNSGLATGPHLHYEIHVNGKVVDPLTYVLSDAIPD
jgi:murein DD-endopeptidase MepM/ murein hydrolase activator NlpD